MITINAREYAAKIGYPPEQIIDRLKNQEPEYNLPFTRSIEKFGNTWLIEIDQPFPVLKARKKFRDGNK